MPSTTTAVSEPSAENEFLVRTSARKSLNGCEWAWEKSYVHLLKPYQTKDAFQFGTLVHRSLEKFYRPGTKRGPHPAKTFLRLYEADLKEKGKLGINPDEEWLAHKDLGVAMLRGHRDLYGFDERYQVLATEQAFQQPVYETVMVEPRSTRRTDPKNTGKVKKVRQRRYRFTYVGVLDGIWLDTETGRLYLVDHKTCASIDQLLKQLVLDVQSSAYWTWGVDWLREQGLLKPKQELDGLLFNMLRKAHPSDKPRNEAGLILNKPTKPVLAAAYESNIGAPPPKGMTVDDLLREVPNALQLGEPSKVQPPPLFHREPSLRGEDERQRARETALDDVDEMLKIINGERRARKMYPSGPFGCQSCQVKDICELHESGDDWETMRDATMETWDPYAEHEVYAGR